MHEFDSSALTVLLVEDDPDDQLIFQDYLEDLGDQAPRVVVAETCDQARQVLIHESVDVCYVDYRLGAESGLEFIAMESKTYPGVPFVQLTGQSGLSIDGNAQLAGARDFMNKSELSPERLLRSIRYVVSQARHDSVIEDQRTVVNSLLNSMGEVLWIRDETSGLFLEMGQGVETFTGHSPSEFIEDAGLWDHLVHPKYREYRKQVIRETVTEQTKDLEYFISDAEGNQHLIQERVRRMRNTNKAFWVVGISRDITQEEESRSRLRLFQQVMQQLDEVILVTDSQLDVPGGPFIVYANPAFTRMTGYTLKEVIGKSPAMLQGPETETDELQDLKKTLQRGDDFTAEVVNYRKDGTQYVVNWSISPVKDTEGNVHYYASIQRDVTKQREMEAQQQRDQRLESLGNLVGGVAHDLNNILSPIMMGAGMLPEADSPEQRKDISESILESAERAAGVVGQLLTFARGGGQQRKYNTLGGVLQEVYRIGQETFPKHIHVDLKQGKDLWVVHASENEIQQVLLNLALNAKDALEDHKEGCIELSVENHPVDPAEADRVHGLSQGDYILLRVKDDGPGMPLQIIDQIFDPFFTTKPEGKGTGLGLSSSMGIIQAHEGAIHVTSHEGEGTCFCVYLPAHPDKRKEEDTEDRSFVHGEGQSILVVDDEPGIVSLVTDMLSQHGYDSHGVTSSREALKYFEQDPDRIDLVVTDVMMPDLDGPTLVKKLRAIRSGLPVLVMSGYVRHEKLEDLNEQGIQGVLHKPIKLEKLMQDVQKALVSPGD